MTDDIHTQLEPIDSATLTPLVRQALGSDTVKVTSWDTKQAYGAGAGSAARSAIHRISGCGKDQGDTLDWSLILKVLYPPADRGQPTVWNYWRREADAYQSGFLDDLPGGLTAPRCFGVMDQPNGECWIWMEDVRDSIGPKWPLEHYGVVARHLGQFSGAYLTGHPVPSCPWLNRNGTRPLIENATNGLQLLHESLHHPLVRRAFPPDKVDALLRRWEQRGEFLNALDGLPQTLCHFDAFRRNLFARCTAEGGMETVAIDWAMVGIGAIGQELKALVGSTLAWREVDLRQWRDLDRIALDGYLDGLRDTGWQGDPRHVRFGKTAYYAMYGLEALAYNLPVLLDESQYAEFQRRWNMSIEEYADMLAVGRNRPAYDHWEQEARQLLDEL